MQEDEKLKPLLSKYYKTAIEISQHISSSTSLRFSYRKFVADLGEYYFKFNCESLFKKNSLIQSETAVSKCDYTGICKNIPLWKGYKSLKVNIEVKTRCAQIGDPYLLNLKKDKFKLLVFVFLLKDYSCNYIGIMDVNNIEHLIHGEDNRLIFKNDIPTLWQSDPFTKLKKQDS